MERRHLQLFAITSTLFNGRFPGELVPLVSFACFATQLSVSNHWREHKY